MHVLKNPFQNECCILVLTEVFGVFQPNAPVWLILNEAGLYWRAVGNSTFAIACLQRALNLAPLQYQDVPLVNLANLLIHYGLHLDATKLLLQALAINSSEVRFYVSLQQYILSSDNSNSEYNMCFYREGIKKLVLFFSRICIL